jgi:hypothetical protein
MRLVGWLFGAAAAAPPDAMKLDGATEATLEETSSRSGAAPVRHQLHAGRGGGSISALRPADELGNMRGQGVYHLIAYRLNNACPVRTYGVDATTIGRLELLVGRVRLAMKAKHPLLRTFGAETYQTGETLWSISKTMYVSTW